MNDRCKNSVSLSIITFVNKNVNERLFSIQFNSTFHVTSQFRYRSLHLERKNHIQPKALKKKKFRDKYCTKLMSYAELETGLKTVQILKTSKL